MFKTVSNGITGATFGRLPQARLGGARRPPRGWLVVCLALVLAMNVVSVPPARGAASAIPRFAEWTFDVQFNQTTTRTAGTDGGNVVNETRSSSFIDVSTTSAQAGWSSSRDGKLENSGCENTPGDTYTETYGGKGSGETAFVDAMEFSEPTFLAEWGVPEGDYVHFDVRPLGYIDVTTTTTDCYNNTESGTSTETFLYGPVFVPGTFESLDAAPVGTVLQLRYGKALSHGVEDTTETTATVTATKRLRAMFTWSVAEQSPDADGDGQLYRYNDGKWSKPLPADKEFNVTLNGCESTDYTGEFTVDGEALNHGCNPHVYLTEGPHSVTLVASDGTSTTRTINVVHHLVVGLGDSFGSGETEGDYDDWGDPNCRRGTWSAQARAAVALEKSSPHSTVTFLHLACSGATVDHGLLTPYNDRYGGKPPGGTAVGKSQVRAAADLTIEKGWDIDAVLLSIGGNDINFSPILTSCAAFRNCPLSKWRFTTKPFSEEVSLHKETMRRLKGLPQKYGKVAKCLTGYAGQTGNCGATDWNRVGSLRVGASSESPGGDASKVLLSEYPDLSTKIGDSGMKSPDGYRYCNNALKGLTITGHGIADEEFAWARQVVQKGGAGTTFTYRKDRNLGRPDVNVKLDVTADGLNRVINAGPSGLTPVRGAFKAFAGHGYCAGSSSWVTTMKLDYLHDGNKTAAFHPNKLGYRKWGGIIAPKLISTLGR